MNETFGYRLLRGRRGAAGHVRSQTGGQTAALRGMTPGAECEAYILSQGEAVLCARGRADRTGDACLSLPPGTPFFVAEGDQVLLWEAGDGKGESYFRACQALMRLHRSRKPEEGRAETSPVLSMEREAPLPEKGSPREKPLPPAVQREAQTIARLPSAVAAQAAKPEEPPVFPAGETGGEEAPASPREEAECGRLEQEEQRTYPLRPAGQGEAVDALPALIWPSAAGQLRVYFETLPPVAPFDAPGWRFVRAPSPLQGVPWCIVGYTAREGRVVGVAYAVPGTPYQPPAALAGYRFYQGRKGEGYWAMWRQVEEALGSAPTGRKP